MTDATESWSVFGYTPMDREHDRELEAYRRDSKIRALEMIAHLLATGCDLIVVQRVEEGQ